MSEERTAEQIAGDVDLAERAAARYRQEHFDIMDAIGASTFIAQYAAPRHRSHLMTTDEYRRALLEAANANRRAAHLHPEGNHGAWASRHQRTYESLR